MLRHQPIWGKGSGSKGEERLRSFGIGFEVEISLFLE
jgi:hypothetical protein